MLKTESITSYLGRFTRIRDELAAVGEIVHQTMVSICSRHCCPRTYAYLGDTLG
jgi:hypothetical protein